MQTLDKFDKSFTGKVSEPMEVGRTEKKEEKPPAFTAFPPLWATPGWVSYSTQSQETSRTSDKKKPAKIKEGGEKTTPSALKADRIFPHSKRVISDGPSNKKKKKKGGG